METEIIGVIIIAIFIVWNRISISKLQKQNSGGSQ